MPMAVALLLASREAVPAAAGAGAVAAFTGLLSPAFLIPLVPTMGVIVAQGPSPRGRRISAAVVAGASVVVGALVWLAAGGALDDVGQQVPGAPANVQQPGLLDVHRWVWLPGRGLWLAGVAGALVAARERRLRGTAAVALVWIVASWLRVKVGDYVVGDAEHEHHAYPGVIGIAIGISLGVTAVWARRARLPRVLAAAAVAALVGVYVLAAQWNAFTLPSQRRGIGGRPWAAASALASFTDRHTTSNSTLLVAGSDAEVYWLAQRRAPTRFFDWYPIEAHPAYLHERNNAIRRHPPAAVAAMPGTRLDSVLRGLTGHGYVLAYRRPSGRVWLRRRA
jgi:hypothetical protein